MLGKMRHFWDKVAGFTIYHRVCRLPLMEALGKLAGTMKRHANKGVVTYHVSHYKEKGGKRITLFSPYLSTGDRIRVLGFQTVGYGNWFNHRFDKTEMQEAAENRTLFTKTRAEVGRLIENEDWTEYDPWREKNVLALWSKISRECNFAQVPRSILEKGHQIVLNSGASATGKSGIAHQLGQLPPATSRGEHEGELNGMRCDDLTKSEILTFGPLQAEDDDGLRLYLEMFAQGKTVCHFLSPHSLEWHFILLDVLEQGVEGLGCHEKRFLPGGLDMAELVKASFACTPEEIPNSRPTIIYNMPAEPTLLEKWYCRRGKKMEQMKSRLEYDRITANLLLGRTDYINVLVGQKEQVAFVPAMERISDLLLVGG